MITPEHLARQAAARPGAIAVIDRGREVSYHAFDRDVRKFVRAIRALGLKPGAIVAIGCEDVYVHFLLLLACERLAVATASILAIEHADTAILAHADLVLVETHFTMARSKPQFAITPQWIASVLAGPADEAADAPILSPDDPVRVLRTSGTTGMQKLVLLKQRTHELRINEYIAFSHIDERARFLVTMPFSVGGIYHHAKACIHAGGAVIIANMNDRLDAVRAIANHAVTHVILMPLQIKQVLDDLPLDFPKPPNLTITSFGGSIGPALRTRAYERLATALLDFYGSNESGFIARMCEAPDGEPVPIWPGVEVEIVDEQDVLQPEGRAGRLRVRSPFMVEDYWHDPEATRAMFKNGWFYPGDVAALFPGRRLRLVGRGDEMLNIGGGKRPPAFFEDMIAAQLKAADIGVCTIRSRAGVDELCIALVQPELRGEELLNRVMYILRSHGVGFFHVMLLNKIPRNALGKIERARLRQEIDDLRSRSAARPGPGSPQRN